MKRCRPTLRICTLVIAAASPRTERSLMRMMPKCLVVLVVLIGLSQSASLAATLKESTHPNDDYSFAGSGAADAPGVPDTSVFENFGNQEQVSLYSGSLNITHPSSPSFPLDGGGTIGVSRVYNSKNVSRSTVTTSSGDTTYIRGSSWVGSGWSLQLGRVFQKSKYTVGATPSHAARTLHYQDSSGTEYELSPHQREASPHFEWEKVTETTYDCAEGLIYAPPTHECCDGTTSGGICNAYDCNCSTILDDIYNVTMPNGTVYRLEERIAEVVDSATGRITNEEEAGYYVVEMTDVHGNKILIDYHDGTAKLKSIHALRSPETTSRKLIWTDLWDSATHGNDSLFDGMLRDVHSLGPNGTTVSYRFNYTREAVPFFPDAALLTSVDLPTIGSAPAGNIGYEYSQERDASYSYEIPRLTRVVYPTGAESAYEYGDYQVGWRDYADCLNRYQSIFNNDQNNPFCNFQCQQEKATICSVRKSKGVTKRTLFPEGDPNDDGSGVPSYHWHWDRTFSHTTNKFVLKSPDGTRTESSFYGDGGERGCESTGGTNCYFGRESTKEYYGADGRLVRVENTTYDDDGIVSPANQVWVAVRIQPLTRETVYVDDGATSTSCFESNPPVTNGVKSVKSHSYKRDSLDQRLVSVLESDAYLRHDRASFTNYENSGVRVNKNILGAADFVVVREGNKQLEAFRTYDDDGMVLEAKSNRAYSIPAAVSDWTTWTPATPSAESSAPTVTYTYLGNGNRESSESSGADATSSFKWDYEWQYAKIKKAELDALTYASGQASIDPSGHVLTTTEPNGLVSSYQYDALGRVTLLDPPGSIEHSQRVIYPDLNQTLTIQSSGSETTHDPFDDDQRYTERNFDGLGRLSTAKKAMPNGDIAVQLTRYDEVGRPIFVSAWIPETTYNTLTWRTWTAPTDRDADGTVETAHYVTVPLSGDSTTDPWGSVTFYGVPSTSDPNNPLAATTEALGRVHEAHQADGSRVTKRYCGPHEETTAYGAQVALDGTTRDITTRHYYNGLGQLVIVDADVRASNAAGDGADAIYDYDLGGNLVKVNLRAQIPSGEPLELWLQDDPDGTGDTIPDGQIRTFEYNAIGQLVESDHPEKGTEKFLKFDSLGNVLEWRDQAGIEQGYRFVNTYDVAGRLTETDLVWDTGAGADWVLTETFDNVGSWAEDDPDSTTNWQIKSYASLSCVSPPPGSSGGSGYYFGENCTNGYKNTPTTPQATKLSLSNVDPRDEITFKYWRQVRQNAVAGTGDRDRFYVAVSLTETGPKRFVLDLDEGQASFSTWRQSPAIKLRDLFTSAEWSSGSKTIWIHFVFDRNDSGDDTGIVTGVVVDDLHVGRAATKPLVRQAYDEDHCTGTIAGDACVSGANHPLDKLTTVKSYQDGRWTSTRRWVFQGLNGRGSATNQRIDWTQNGWDPTATPSEEEASEAWIWSTDFDSYGQASEVTAPYLPNTDWPRDYVYEYYRGALNKFHELLSNGVEIQFFSGSEGLLYDASGATTLINYIGSQQIIARDLLNRPTSIHSSGLDGVTLWNSDTYDYDGVGNIIAIGEQEYAYDSVGRLVEAHVTKQASQADLSASARDAYDIEYAYDIYGNMTSRCEAGGATTVGLDGLRFGCTDKDSDGTVDPFDHADNRISGHSQFDYDANGNMTRFSGPVDQQVGAAWDHRNRMRVYFGDDPVGQGSMDGGSPVEQYLYDASGYRLVKIDKTGVPKISLRDGTGQAISEYEVSPGASTPEMTLDKDFLYGAGQLLVEREVGDPAPEIQNHSTMSVGSGYVLEVTSGTGYDSYTIDIWTESGYRNVLTNIQLDPTNLFTVDEADLSADETNYIRVKGVGADRDSLYSHPVTLFYDPNAVATNPNPIRAASISRDSTDIVVRWKLLQPASSSKLYFLNPQTGQSVPLTPIGTAPGTSSVTIDSQSLSSVCGSFELFTLLVGGGESGPTGPVDNTRDAECGTGGQPPSDPPTGPRYEFVNAVHHRDHLGTLRVAVDETGASIIAQAADFFPFGMQMGSSADQQSDRKYTGHERDQDTELDYMLARYCSSFTGRFFSPDPIIGRPGNANSWNRYAYVQNRPMSFVDPDGRELSLALGGPTKRNGFGHIAIIHNDTVYSSGSNWSRSAEGGDWGVSTESYFETPNQNGLTQDQSRETTIMELDVTPEQEAEIVAILQQGPGEYNEVANNCAQACAKPLQRSGAVKTEMTPVDGGTVSVMVPTKNTTATPDAVAGSVRGAGIVKSETKRGTAPKNPPSKFETVVSGLKDRSSN